MLHVLFLSVGLAYSFLVISWLCQGNLISFSLFVCVCVPGMFLLCSVPFCFLFSGCSFLSCVKISQSCLSVTVFFFVVCFLAGLPHPPTFDCQAAWTSLSVAFGGFNWQLPCWASSCASSSLQTSMLRARASTRIEVIVFALFSLSLSLVLFIPSAWLPVNGCAALFQNRRAADSPVGKPRVSPLPPRAYHLCPQPASIDMGGAALLS